MNVIETVSAHRQRYLDLMEKVVLNEINPESGARTKYLLDILERGRERPRRHELLNALINIRRGDPTISAALKELYAPRNWWTKVLGFPYSMIGPKRIANVRETAEAVIREGVRGAFVETGVWRGGACIMMKAVMVSYGECRGLYACDSFQGLPTVESGPDAELKLSQNPLLAAPLEDVRLHFERLGLLDHDVYFIEGWFDETIPQLAASGPAEIAILRLDGDYYHSTKVVLDHLYHRVSSGGYVIIDDYGAYEQCAMAVDEFRLSNNIETPMIDIDGVGLYWRIE